MPPIVHGLAGRRRICLCTHVNTTGIRELRASLADVVRRAEAGERTIVSARGRPVAQVAPLDEAAPDIERLIAAGGLIAPRRVGGWRAPDPVPIWSGVRIDTLCVELRG